MNKNIYLIISLSLLFINITQAQIAVNEDNSLPDASALMDMKSTNKGLLIPRMTTIERIAIPSPAIGLMIYDNTTNSFWYYNVSVWKEIGASAASAVLQDADNDTKIQVEESVDEDVIRMDIGGSERLVITTSASGATTIDFPNNDSNIFLGEDAGKSTTVGHSNIFNGYRAGYSNTAGHNNIFNGAGAGNANTTGNYNIFTGRYAGGANTTGNHNIFTGLFAGRINSTGSYNIFLGSEAGRYETGSNKLYIESSSSSSPLIYGEFDTDLLRINGTLNINNAFSFPIADGTNGQTLVTDGSGNVAWASPSGGSSSSTLLQDADNDTKIQVEESADEDVIRFDIGGSESLVLKKNPNGVTMIELPSSYTNRNTFIGKDAGLNTDPTGGSGTGRSNTFIGYETGKGNTTGYANAFSGEKAGTNNTTGALNAFFGAFAGANNTTGGSNTFMGQGAGYLNTTGKHNTFIGISIRNNTTGAYNTFIGSNVGYLHTTGDYNTFMGREAGYKNVAGSSNVFLGHQAGYDETGSHKLYIQNSKLNAPLIYGEFNTKRIVINGNATNNTNSYTFCVNGTAGGNSPWNNSSDRRLKTNIQTVPNALDKALQLRGVTYEWKDGREKGNRLGFIAQEVAEILPEVVDKTGEFYTMQYAPLTAILVEAIQEQQKEIDEQKKIIQQLQAQTAQIDELKEMMVQLQAQVSTNNLRKDSE